MKSHNEWIHLGLKRLLHCFVSSPVYSGNTHTHTLIIQTIITHNTTNNNNNTQVVKHLNCVMCVCEFGPHMSLSSVEKYFSGISPAAHQQKTEIFLLFIIYRCWLCRSICRESSRCIYKKVYEKLFEPIEMLKANKNNRLVSFFLYISIFVGNTWKMCL